MNNVIKAQLERNKRLEDRIDLAVTSAIILALVIVCAWVGWDAVSTSKALPAVVLHGVLILVIGALLFSAGTWASLRLTAQFAPTFVIDETNPSVVKLYGSIRLDGADKAEEQLLATRPGLQLYRGDAFEDFGCTLAAVPASSAFLQAKAELLELGVTIR